MKIIFLFYYLIVQITITDASNQYLGCFIDQIGNRDLEIFISDYEQLTPKQCILACREQDFPYAAIQYGNECRCGQQYGKHGQTSDDECDYLCSTSEKCGGDNRNSVYSVIDSIDTDSTCHNSLIGYQGCFDIITLPIKMDVVNSIEECVKRCAVKYNYAGIMNGDLCHCGNDLNRPSSNLNLCNLPCNTSLNNITIDCCGGLRVLSVYNVNNYQSPLTIDLSEKLVRVKRADAANDTTFMSTQTSTATITANSSQPSITTILSSILTSSSSTLLSTTGSSSNSMNLSTVSSMMPSSTTISHAVSLTSNSISDTSTSAHSSLIISSTPISPTNTVGTILTTSQLSPSTTPTSTGVSTLTVVTTVPSSTNSISFSQSLSTLMTNTMSSYGSSSISTNIPSSIGTFFSFHTDTSYPTGTTITSTAPGTSTAAFHTDTSYPTGTIVTSTVPVTSMSIFHTDTSHGTGTTILSTTPGTSTLSFHTDTSYPIGTTILSTAPATSFSAFHTDTSQSSSQATSVSTASPSHTDTTNPTSSTSLSSSTMINTASATLTSIHTDTSQSVTSLYMTSNSQSSSSVTTGSSASIGTSITNTMTSLLTSSQSMPTVSSQLSSTHVSQTSTVLTSSSFATAAATAYYSSSYITPTYASQSTVTVSLPSSSTGSSISSSNATLIQSTSSIATTPLSSTSSLASSSKQSTVPTVTTSLQTGTTNQTTVSTQSSVTTTSINSSSTATTPAITSNTITTTTTVAPGYVISTVFIVPSTQTFNTSDNNTQESIRQRLISIINLGFRCVANSSFPNCTQATQRRKRQACSNGYNVILVSSITGIANTSPPEYQVNYIVTDLCNSGALVPPLQVKTATSTLSRTQISNMLGYQYDGDFIKSTSIITNTPTPTADPKLWLIGAVLGPVAFVLLLICAFCYLHYKCRPRTSNRPLDKGVHNPSQLSARSANYQSVPDESLREKPTTGKNVYVLTQNDPLVGASTSIQHLTPMESQKSTNSTPQYPISMDIPMEEIRRQNEIERWRNKLRLQEKFQQPSNGLQDPSVPNSGRSMPHQHDNRAFEYDPSNINIQPEDDVVSVHSARRTPQTTEIEVGRTKLHRLLDEVLDKAESEESYNPDSETERRKRRRQQRRIHSISNNEQNPPINNDNQQIRHTPVIPQVSDRPDPSLLRLRYNHYEAGDRAHDISRFAPVELKPKYATDDNETDRHYTQFSSRSNPPLFYDDSTIADRAVTATDAYGSPKRSAKTRLETDREAMMRHDGGQIDRRQHKFTNDAVYIATISKNPNEYRVQARTAWAEPEIHNDPLKRNDYRDEYIMAKRSVLNTRDIISSINDELKHITLPSSGNYHA